MIPLPRCPVVFISLLPTLYLVLTPTVPRKAEEEHEALVLQAGEEARYRLCLARTRGECLAALENFIPALRKRLFMAVDVIGPVRSAIYILFYTRKISERQAVSATLQYSKTQLLSQRVMTAVTSRSYLLSNERSDLLPIERFSK